MLCAILLQYMATTDHTLSNLKCLEGSDSCHQHTMFKFCMIKHRATHSGKTSLLNNNPAPPPGWVNLGQGQISGKDPSQCLLAIQSLPPRCPAPCLSGAVVLVHSLASITHNSDRQRPTLSSIFFFFCATPTCRCFFLFFFPICWCVFGVLGKKLRHVSSSFTTLDYIC